MTSLGRSIPGGEHPPTWFHHWIYYLASGFIFAAVALRSMLVFQDAPVLRLILSFLGAGLVLFIGVSLLPPHLPKLTAFLIICQAALVLFLLLRTSTDYFAILFTILGMQVVQHFPPRTGWAFVGLGFALTFFTLLGPIGTFQALALAAGVSAFSVFAVFFQLSSKRARQAQEENQALAGRLQEANHQLQGSVKQQEQLAGVRARQALARELHDSITQTIFSMNLTTQSAMLLLERNPAGVAEQLQRLELLARSALEEIQVLISRLAPEQAAPEGLEALLRKHLAERQRLDNLVVDLQVDGGRLLDPREERSLFHIAQEALNNIVKHAGVNRAAVRLHLDGQPWLEIEDRGSGFEPQSAGGGGQLGLAGMHEQAAEIGWTLQVDSMIGQGTRIRATKETEGAKKT